MIAACASLDLWNSVPDSVFFFFCTADDVSATVSQRKPWSGKTRLHLHPVRRIASLGDEILGRWKDRTAPACSLRFFSLALSRWLPRVMIDGVCRQTDVDFDSRACPTRRQYVVQNNTTEKHSECYK